MNEPKAARAPVDVERLVRELRAALKSLNTVTAPPTCSSPSDEEQRQRSPQSQEDRSKGYNLIGDPLSKISPDPRPKPRTPAEPLTEPVSQIEAREPEQIPAFKSAKKSNAPHNQIAAQSSQYEIIEGFCRNHKTIERFRVTPQELKALSSAARLGSLACKQDLVFMLRQIGVAKEPANLQATIPREPVHISDEHVEPSIPRVKERAERIRREAFGRLTNSNSFMGVARRRPLRRFVVFSLALVLMATTTGTLIEMTPNLAHHPLSNMGRVFLSGGILSVAGLIVAIYLRWRRSLRRSSRRI